MATGCSKVLWSETNTSSNFQVEWKLCLKNLFPTIPWNGLPCHSPKYALPVHGCFNTLILFLVIQYNKVWEACIQIDVYTNNLRIIKPHFYWLLKDGIDSIFSTGFSYNSVDIFSHPLEPPWPTAAPVTQWILWISHLSSQRIKTMSFCKWNTLLT